MRKPDPHPGDFPLMSWAEWVRLYADAQGFGGGADRDPYDPRENYTARPGTHSDPVFAEVAITSPEQDRAMRVARHLAFYPKRERQVAWLQYVGRRKWAGAERAGEPAVWRCYGEVMVARGVRFPISLPRPPDLVARPWRWVNDLTQEDIAEAIGVTDRHVRRLLDLLRTRICEDLAADRVARRNHAAA